MTVSFKQVITAYELLDSARVDGWAVAGLLKEAGLEDVEVKRITGPKGSTDFIKVRIPGSNGKMGGGEAPTLGIIGRLGGIGARPERIGFVSDGDGALAAVATALKLGAMQKNGDTLTGDVIIATHICPQAPTRPHDPVPFMDSPVDIAEMNRNEVDPAMDAILSVDTTKGNRVINHRGFAISPTVKEGYILRISEDLLDLMQIVTGKLPVVFPLTTQDITPYGNGLYHLNSILQPCVATAVPVVGVAITAEVPVPGCATGATHLVDIEAVVRFCIEVAKAFGQGKCHFYDGEEFERLKALYGAMNHLQTLGKEQ
ncbi:hypothetical protein MTHERMOG20_22590 [Moorella thermoacetica]|uniref:DUF1177 domain-containing protein n=1 Tax=Neomoorella thermoacetica TaxID=1525 RepID=A0A1J5N4A6_NEOTH|nr:hypothetical protein MOTHA_c02210 [Moorella thermoacetica]OIQ07987.1 hypothetical protein MOOR_24280 [Moorella thermoacetica]OIQ53324.1 hypothetical protein MORE_20510 [Moorella thermoacetica]OIQ53698.1 hypothetical protein MOCA_24690 [Moorella thermoacetica]QCZ99401.1 hypothetical protein MothHH_00228 [Moorella thermoacetica]